MIFYNATRILYQQCYDNEYHIRVVQAGLWTGWVLLTNHGQRGTLCPDFRLRHWGWGPIITRIVCTNSLLWSVAISRYSDLSFIFMYIRMQMHWAEALTWAKSCERVESPVKPLREHQTTGIVVMISKPVRNLQKAAEFVPRKYGFQFLHRALLYSHDPVGLK